MAFVEAGAAAVVSQQGYEAGRRATLHGSGGWGAGRRGRRGAGERRRRTQTSADTKRTYVGSRRASSVTAR
jgi:hypothetical protein